MSALRLGRRLNGERQLGGMRRRWLDVASAPAGREEREHDNGLKSDVCQGNL